MGCVWWNQIFSLPMKLYSLQASLYVFFSELMPVFLSPPPANRFFFCINSKRAAKKQIKNSFFISKMYPSVCLSVPLCTLNKLPPTCCCIQIKRIFIQTIRVRVWWEIPLSPYLCQSTHGCHHNGSYGVLAPACRTTLVRSSVLQEWLFGCEIN